MDDGKKGILVVSEDPLFGRALRRAMGDEYELKTTGTLPTSDPDVDLIVWHLGTSPIPTQATMATFSCPTLVLGAAQEKTIVGAVEAGVAGFVVEDAPLDEIVTAITIVSEGGAVVPPAFLGALLRHLVEKRRRSGQSEVLNHLTTRELDVFRLAATGARREDIAQRLFISPDTARTHLQRVYRKLGIHSRAELVALAARTGLLETQERE